MNATPTLGTGLYTIAEAARLLQTQRKTLARWVEGYVQHLRFGTKAYPPVVPAGMSPDLTFGDLVELLYVRLFRNAGVPLDDIRRAAAKYRREWGIPYPLATKRFATDGQGLLLKEGDAWRHALTGQQVAFFEELGSQLVHVGGLAVEWRPLGERRAVLLDPDRSFGKPIEDASGAHTSVLASALEAGDSPEQVAWWYGTSVSGVLDARDFEAKWAPHRRRRAAA